MKTISLATPLRVLAFAALLGTAPVFAAVSEMASADRAVQHLANHGALPVVTVGPYIERGTLRIQVSTKLGRPNAVLPDGTWLYENRTVQESNARGTLVIRFDRGRVSELALVTPAVATAMRADPHKPLGSYLVATK